MELIRDNRCTELRSHRADRQKARVMLKNYAEDNVPAGKMRRYSLQYGDCIWVDDCPKDSKPGVEPC